LGISCYASLPCPPCRHAASHLDFFVKAKGSDVRRGKYIKKREDALSLSRGRRYFKKNLNRKAPKGIKPSEAMLKNLPEIPLINPPLTLEVYCWIT
jgi:hypothetical protein